MLSDADIRRAILSGSLLIDPCDERRLQPASYDVSLHPTVLVLQTLGEPLDPKVDTAGEWHRIEIPDTGYDLMPGDFALGSTVEVFGMGNYFVGKVEGKSSLGRLGLEVHATAGFVDPGFHGQITLELSCVHARGIRLYPNMPIGQVAIDYIPAVERPYAGKYTNQFGPTASRYHENWDGQAWK